MSRGGSINDLELLRGHFEAKDEVGPPPTAVFVLLDDHRRLSAHMTKSSWMMGKRVAKAA